MNLKTYKPRLTKKALCIILSLIMALGTFITFTVGYSPLHDWLGIRNMLSAYAAEIVDTKGAVAVDEEAMLADDHTINLINKSGENTVYIFTEPIAFTDENGNLKTKDITVEKSNSKLRKEGYEYTNGQNDFRINFSKSHNKGVNVQGKDFSYSLIPKSAIKVDGSESVAEYLGEKFEVFQYENIYGNKTNLRFYPQLNGVKDEIVLEENINKNVFDFELKCENCTARLNEDGTVSLINNKEEIIQTFSVPFAYDSEYIEGDNNSHYSDCKYALENEDENLFVLTITVPDEWINDKNTVYPIFIDPSVNSDVYKDTSIQSKNASSNYGSTSSLKIGKDSADGTCYALEKFALPDAILKGEVIDSAYLWEKDVSNGSNSATVEAHFVTTEWYENEVTWNTRPSYNSSAISTRNINGNSNDKSNDPTWYKFDITSAMQQWSDRTASNWGILFKGNSTMTENLRTRAFASEEHSTSSYRPYAVITYIKDTTKPTVGDDDIIKNHTGWTNQNVIFTVNATDSGVGLHSYAYSFTESDNTSNWQSSKVSNAFDHYAYVTIKARDKRGNETVRHRYAYIDKLAPPQPTVSGVPSNWTSNSFNISVVSDDAPENSNNGKSGVKYYSCTKVENSYDWKSVTEVNTAYSFNISENGTYYIYAKDQAGNISPVKTLNISIIDSEAPSAPVLTGNENEWNSEAIRITANSTDVGSGVAEYSFSEVEDVYEWQTENYHDVDEDKTLYVYSKDGVGNISNVSTTIVRFDSDAPIGGTITGNPTDWTNSVTLSVNGVCDELSGLNASAFSFSNAQNQYNWQSENYCNIQYNGSVYIYARDNANNISHIGTINVTKLDNTEPAINDISYITSNGITTVTVDASDNQSGVALYSFDRGQTWQSSNEFSFSEDSYNFIYVKVKDNAGNISTQKYDFYTPSVYKRDGKIYLYNSNQKCSSVIYYRGSNSLSWNEYSEPITDIPNHLYVSFDNLQEGCFSQADLTAVNIPNEETFSPGKYKESKTDATFKYRNVSFDFSRIYESETNSWFFSFYSNLTFDSENNIITVKKVDGNTSVFLPVGIDEYVSTKAESKVLIIRNNDGSFKCYRLIINESYYNYNGNGVLTSVSNKYEDEISFSWSNDTLEITDSAQRTYSVSIGSLNNVTGITDPAGKTISYTYANNKLTEVTDQAGITISQYQYDILGRLSKSMDKSIHYDNSGRVERYEYDNGAYVNYSYSGLEVTVNSSDNEYLEIEYDEYGKILSYILDGDTYIYDYDEYDNIYSIEKNEEIINRFRRDSRNRLKNIMEEDGSRIFYYYNDNDQCIRQKTTTSDNDVYYDYFCYNSLGEIILSARLNGEDEDAPDEYNENLECFTDIIEYSYNNGLLSQTSENNEAKTTQYFYDNYGNNTQLTIADSSNNELSLSTVEYTYDLFGNVLTETENNKTTSYIYDAAGRKLLTNSDGKCQRNVYDNLGRIIQSIDPSVYDSTKEGLPQTNIYDDENVGHRYVYDSNTGNLTSEINKYGLTTTYYYNNVGNLIKKHFDIYDYYYYANGDIEKVEVNGSEIVSYEYGVNKQNVTLQDGQTISKTTYADGYIEEQKLDEKGNVLARYSDESEAPYYSVISYSNNSIMCLNNNTGFVSIYNTNENSVEKKTGIFGNRVQYYKAETDEDEGSTTINETHFGNDFTTTITDSLTSFSYNNSTIDYSFVSDEDSVSEEVKSGETVLLSADYDFSVENEYQKSYNINGISFEQKYDEEKGYISSDENYYYFYDEYGELTTVSTDINADNEPVDIVSSYTYDDRGNMQTKTVNNDTKSFAYTSNTWNDQLTSVNGVSLSYDDNGNLSSYGSVQYQWSYGKRLQRISDGNNIYSYAYDENGIRSSKTVNGVSTSFNTLNGKVLAQKTGNDVLYFQYSNDTPIGFIHNGTQYFYLTNLSGDVMGITDGSGNLIATYTYDAWGKLLGITPAQENNSAQYALAMMNPLRYRGYYYDNETGMYYLQSRYYNPDWGRFISTDDFEYINSSSKFGINSYAYCVNNPLIYSDATGNAYVSEAGKAVSDFLGILFMTLDAQELLGDDFACFIASVFTINPSKLYFKFDKNDSPKEKEKKRKKALKKLLKWYNDTVEDFEDLMKSSFYKIVKIIKKDFFFEFFKKAVSSKKMFADISITDTISISFGYGNNNGFLSELSDIFSGHYKWIDKDGFSLGSLFPPNIGLFIEKVFHYPNDFNGSISYEFDIEYNILKLATVMVIVGNEFAVRIQDNGYGTIPPYIYTYSAEIGGTAAVLSLIEVFLLIIA